MNATSVMWKPQPNQRTMREFTNNEREIILKLKNFQSEKSYSLGQALEYIFFSAKKALPLIIDHSHKLAILYFKPKVYADEKAKKVAEASFWEFLSLIDYLNREQFIQIEEASPNHPELPVAIYTGFKNLHREGNALYLNDKGEHTEDPLTIINKDNEVIFKGQILKQGVFNWIVSNTFGSIKKMPSFTNVLKACGVNESKALVPQNKTTKKEMSQANKAVINQPRRKMPIKDIAPGNTIMQISKSKQGRLLILLSIVLILIAAALVVSHLYLSNKIDKHAFISRQAQSDSQYFNSKTDASESVVFNVKDHTKSLDKHARQSRLFGIDISHWQGDLLSDLHAMDSLSFVICKATEGIQIVDKDFNENWAEIKKHGKVRGAYHFYDYNYDPVAQAEFFIKHLHPLGGNAINPILDVEERSLPKRVPLDDLKLQSDLLLWLTTVEKLTEKKPILYTNLYFANTYLKNPKFASYSLWLAEYGRGESPTIPDTWKDSGFFIWQKSDRYHIESSYVDFDTFNGSTDELIRGR